MTTRFLIRALILLGMAHVPAFSQDNTDLKNDPSLKKYLVDVAPSPVTAGGLVGLSKSAITTIQTAQDFGVLWNPLTSKDSKAGIGVSMTPARTDFVNWGGAFYMKGRFHQAASNLTISYAQNFTDIAAVSYKKVAYSLDTYFYWNEERDPVILGYKAFLDCNTRRAAQKEYEKEVKSRAMNGQPDLSEEEKAKYMKKIGDVEKVCDADPLKAVKWNDSRIGISYSDGDIEKESGGGKQSLGRSLIISSIIGTGDDSGVYASYRRTQDAVDTKSLATIAKFSNSSLAAIRYVAGTGDATLRYLIEISNAKSSGGEANSGLYQRALGVDKQMAQGVWLQFRYGKSTTNDGKGTVNKGLLSLAITPSCLLAKCPDTKK